MLGGPPSVFGPIQADVLRVVDGDTVHVAAHVWPGATMQVHVRLAGVDTAEIFRPACERERVEGQRAAEFVRGVVDAQKARVELHQVRLGKFAGRVVAHIHTADGRDLSQRLLEYGLAEPEGGPKPRDRLCLQD